MALYKIMYRLTSYYESNWIRKIKPGLFSVYLQSHRTNNIIERYHRALKEDMATNPELYKFLVCLKRIQERYYLNWCVVEHGSTPNKLEDRKSRQRERKIMNAWESLKNIDSLTRSEREFKIRNVLNELRHIHYIESEFQEVPLVDVIENHEIETEAFNENSEVQRLSLNEGNDMPQFGLDDNKEFHEVSFVENCAVNNPLIGKRAVSIQTPRKSQPRIISDEKLKGTVTFVNRPKEHVMETSNGSHPAAEIVDVQENLSQSQAENTYRQRGGRMLHTKNSEHRTQSSEVGSIKRLHAMKIFAVPRSKCTLLTEKK